MTKQLSWWVYAPVIALLCAAVEIGAALGAEQSPHIVGWRLPSMIVLRGPTDGVGRLRDELKGSAVKELDAGASSREDGEPTSMAKLIVSVLAQMDAGRIELKGGELTAEGIANAKIIEDLKGQIATRTPPGTLLSALRIDSRENAPFHWSAVKGFDEGVGADVVTLAGDVRDGLSRGRIIATMGTGDILVDRMTERPSVPSEASAAAEALLPQLRLLEDGFVWIYGSKVDLIGTARNVKVADDRDGCRVLLAAMPGGIECGTVRIRAVGSGYTAGYGGTPRPQRMPPPKQYVAVKPAEPDADSVKKASDPRIRDILYATVRQRDESDEGSPGVVTYTGERSQTLSFGRARVHIPEGHKIGRIEIPGGFSLFGIQLGQQSGFELRSVQPLDPSEWNALIDAVKPHEALIFVHGFNNSFQASVFRLAQISFDLGYTGLPVLFSWASRGAVADYEYDRNSALLARDAFIQLLDNLQKKHGISKVHVLAHSMGNFLVLDALANRSSMPRSLGHLIMAAPDIDRNEFTQDVPKIKGMCKGLTLYASSKDHALALSMKIAGGISRAGYVPPEGPIVLPGVETLDVTALGAELFDLNHSTFAEARPLIDDIGLILAEDRRAPRLAEERPAPEGITPPRYWRFAP
ncbi:MAG: alpha/beta hydrolase [Methylocystis sp.]|uniref:alpha/beta hydrolase n=1 Tax=Methylocystis sp. TaxID=1911079 RepID=UPI003DA48F10